MEHSKIPRVYVTLRCNYNCSFCVQKNKSMQIELDTDSTVNMINSLKGDEVYIVGGEPFIRKDIVEIINGIKGKKITIYSNGSYDLDVLKQFNKKVTLFCSYHTNKLMSADQFVDKMIQTKQIHNVSAVSAVNGTITNEEKNKIMSLQRYGIKPCFGDNQWNSPHYRYMQANAKKSVVCRFDRVLIGPDGLQYQCVHKLENRIGGYDPNSPILSIGKPCTLYGNCSACDVVVHKVQFV